MAGRQKVVLYNPRAVFYAMPLALVAVGSALDPERYDVVVIDGRLERDLVAKVASAAEGALVLGVTTLTGAPLRDALAVTRAVRARHPRLPIVWGGWHASLFPGETLGEVPIDAVVVGQGEETFAEIVDGLAAGESIGNVAGAMSSRSVADIAPATLPIDSPAASPSTISAKVSSP